MAVLQPQRGSQGLVARAEVAEECSAAIAFAEQPGLAGTAGPVGRVREQQAAAISLGAFHLLDGSLTVP
jgi:hypothetical protein